MRTVSLSGKNQKRHLSRPSSKSFGAMRSLQKNQQIFLGLVCAVFMWISGMYTGLYWTHINVKPTTSVGSFMENASISVPIFQKTSSCPSYVSVVWDVGRFGNQLFNYLVARLTAQVLGHEIFIMEDFADVFNQYFIGRKTQIVDWSYLKYECGIPESECAVREVNYLPELQPTSNETFRCIKFKGYPVNITTRQWEEIFAQRDELVKEFQWTPKLKQSTDKILQEIRTNHTTSTVVAVHARRTDYRSYLQVYYGSFRPANTSYFMKAMDYFRKKYSRPAFLIFSDDMKWCRENLIGSDIIYSGNGNSTDPGQDLALISSCDHRILSYGTFGMATAWLSNRGEVIAADNFTGRPEQMVEALKKVPTLKWIWLPV